MIQPNFNPSDHVALETITPATARDYLEVNTHNRSISKRHVRELASDLSKGLWVVNGDAIRFDTEGGLIDGQHRLLAIVESGVPAQTLVLRNLVPEAFATIDSNKVRGGRDVLSIMGIPDPQTVTPALRLAQVSNMAPGWDGQRLDPGKNKVTNREFPGLIAKFPDLLPAVERIMRADRKTCRRLITPGAVAFLYAWFTRIDTEDADAFFETLEFLHNVPKDHPISLLHHKLSDLSSRGGKGYTNKRHAMALTIKTWNVWRSGEAIKLLRWSASSPFPSPM